MQSIKQYIKTRTTDELILAALVFLLPFERIPSIDVFGISLRPSFIVAAILIIRGLIVLIRQKFQPLVNDLSTNLLLAFMLWIAVTCVVAINVPRAGMVVIFTLFTAMTALAVRVLYKPKYLETITNALLVSACIVAIFGLYQYFANMAGLSSSLTGIREQYSWQLFGFPRIHSTALEPLYYCSYLLIPISYLMVRILRKQNLQLKEAGLFVLLASSVVLTLSRGGVVAMLVVMFATISLMTIQHKTSLKKAAGLIALLVLSAALALTIISTVSREPLNKTITNGEEGAAGYGKQLKKTSLDGSGDDRAVTRQYAIDIMKQDARHTVIGIGPGQFGPHYQNNKATENGGWRIVNNETLELLVEYGIIGFMLFVSFMLAVLFKAWSIIKESSEATSIMIIALISYMVGLAVQYQTFSTLYIMHVWVVIGLLMALSVSNKQTHGRSKG